MQIVEPKLDPSEARQNIPSKVQLCISNSNSSGSLAKVCKSSLLLLPSTKKSC